MAKYIIYNDKLLKRMGGPSTYLYNLKEGTKNTDINFIYDKSENNIQKKDSFIKKIIIKTPKIYELCLILKRKKISEFYKNIPQIGEDEIVMFHNTEDFIKSTPYIKSKCTKILMSHSPEIMAKEISDKAIVKNPKYNFPKLKSFYLNKYDIPAFKNADIIVFPSKEAMEPYYETCDNFDEIIKDKRIEYIETGTSPLSHKYSKMEYRKKYNIPKNAFVISYIGRHNKVKGYDILIKIFEKTIEKYDDIYVITGGVGPIESPNNSRWIDIGWTNDPGSIINASDLFILPNRRTYFDLALLEVLSTGTTCLASNTGGNKSVSKKTDGVLLYKDIENAVEIIEKLHKDRKNLEKLGSENKKAFDKYYTIDKFANNYIEFFRRISNEKK